MIPFSIVIPVFNEQESILALVNEIKNVCVAAKLKTEIIVVNDGSTDNTSTVLKKLSNVRLITLRTNYGQTAAIQAGIDNCKYQTVVTIDGDGQNDPNDIPAMLNFFLDKNLDLLCGWRKNRSDTFLKRFTSLGARKIRTLVFGNVVHDSGCTLKVINVSSVKEIELSGDMHRFLPEVMRINGFKVDEIVVNHRPRSAGTTKYNWRRVPRSLFDIFGIWFWNKYKNRPFHLFGLVSFYSFALAAGLALTAIIFETNNITLFRNILPIVSSLLFLSGIQFILTGLIANIVISNNGISANKLYAIKYN